MILATVTLNGAHSQVWLSMPSDPPAPPLHEGNAVRLLTGLRRVFSDSDRAEIDALVGRVRDWDLRYRDTPAPCTRNTVRGVLEASKEIRAQLRAAIDRAARDGVR